MSLHDQLPIYNTAFALLKDLYIRVPKFNKQYKYTLGNKMLDASQEITSPKRMRMLPLSQGKVATVDDADFDSLNQWKWHAHSSGGVWYAARNTTVEERKQGQPTLIYMHRFLTGYDLVDHIDGDGLHNQRSNLRKCTRSQNCMNQRKAKNATSRYKGVSWSTRHNCWRMKIRLHGRQIVKYYGRKREIDAAKAYDQKAKELFGEFAKINFPSAA